MKKLFVLGCCITLFLFASCDLGIEPFGGAKDGKIPYLELTSEQIEWLDLNGYWVFEDLYKNVDTAYVHSEVKKSVKYGNGSAYAPYWYQDEVELTVNYCPMIGSDSSIFLMIDSNYDRNFYPEPPIMLCGGDSIFNFNWCSDNFVESLYDNPNPIPSDSSVFLMQSVDYNLTHMDRYYNLTFILKKGIGISSYKYEDGDSTYIATLIDYQLE